MKSNHALAVIVMSIVPPVAAAHPVDPLVEAERAFAALSESSGIRASFLANLADEAVLFAPGPVLGRKRWSERPESPASLRWAPAYAEIAASGELGFDYGPWILTPPGEGDPATGQFFSVWRRGRDGAFKVVLDGGISGPAAGSLPTEVRRRTPSALEETTDAARAARSFERACSEWRRTASRFGVVKAALGHSSPDLVVLREGFAPAEGRAAAIALLTRGAGRFDGINAFHAVARSGDLAYTYGTGTAMKEEGGKTVRSQAAFVQVWRREGREWALAADLLLPYPSR